MTPSLRLLLTVSVLASTAFVASADIADDFNDNNDNGWSFADLVGNGSRSVSGGRYTISGTAASATRADELFVDGNFRVDVTSWATGVAGGSSFGLLFHYDAPTVSGYALTIDDDGSPTLSFIKFQGGQQVPGGASSGTLTLDQAADDYTLEVIAFGGNFSGNLYSKNSGQLVSSINWSDFTFTSPNRTGMLVVHDSLSAGGPSATFDNFIASSSPVPVPEPGTVALAAMGLVGLGLAVRKRR